ncbi:flotillin family protein, partial [bacterium]|nr:flotillin family protein [bacterium]
LGGQKVIMNGGSLVLPVLHETIPVNMNTLRLEVTRKDEAALITRDRMRVDVISEFYVRVKPTEEAIADAAQTLGRRTTAPEDLKDLVEGKFVDALRSVAAEMAMEELHVMRSEFVQKVQQVVSEDLLKNGLELEAVSLTGLDQTNREFLNPDNVFDAQGLTRLTEETESRRKQRNDIEQDTEVQIKTKNLEAEKKKLDVAREEEYARLSQEREIAIRSASQAAEIAKERAEKDREAKEAEIAAKQKIEEAKIHTEKVIQEQTIEKEQLVKEADVLRNKAIEAAEIDKKKAIELAEQDRAIAIAEKSKDQSLAQKEANFARADAVKAEEQVVTAREAEKAERNKRIELIEASRTAEKEAIGITVKAEAEKRAAEDDAEAIKTIAAAEAEKVKIAAMGMAEKYKVESEGTKAVHEAENVLSEHQIAMKIKMALIDALPQILAEAVKPMENIDGIKIIQVDGLNASGEVAGNTEQSNGHSQGGNLANQVVNSALRYRAQAPLVDALMKEVGLNAGDINGLTDGLLETAVVKEPVKVEFGVSEKTKKSEKQADA